ncbi:MAG: caspase family protein [Thermodesulfovibrionales bacterium]|nr:caspase family protein [Thermodesulfovibrionales bacterium]
MKIKDNLISLVSVIFILLVSMAMTGCAHFQRTVESVEIKSMNITAKSPLKVAILIPSEVSGMKYIQSFSTGSVTYYPGQILEKSSIGFFKEFFENPISINSMLSSDIDIDIVIAPMVINFLPPSEHTRFDSEGEYKATTKITLYDRAGREIWNDITSSQIRLKNWWDDAGRTIIVNNLQKMAEKMFSAKKVISFAAAIGKPIELIFPTAQAEQKQPKPTEPPVPKSDVDELPAIKAKPNKNAYAIVIGIENYRQKLPKADYAVADAKTMTEYLTKVMGYPEENVVTLLNEHAAKSDFEKYFEKWLPNNVEKDGSVFIYYSGHGAPNTKTGDAFLVPYDGDPSFIEQTGYPLKRLYESLNKLQAKEIIVALDSCFSGAGGKSVIAKGARPLVMNLEQDIKLSKNMIVMSASSGDQISSTYEEKGHGLFTYFMLKGIKDGITEIGELFDYLKPHVGRTARKVYNNEQTPQLIAPDKKKVFLRN